MSMSSRDDASLGASPPTYEPQNGASAPPTYATFSPVTISSTAPSRSSRRSTILVHQKSPLLLATPPQITRALAYSHPFILPLNTFVGLLTWSTGDPWQSFLLLCAFWMVVLYGDSLTLWAGPVIAGAGLIAGMYGRRYSPLSSSGWGEPGREAAEADAKTAVGGGHSRNPSKSSKAGGEEQYKRKRAYSEVTNTKHQKTLDEIIETLKEFTGRCNLLLEPLFEMTDFLSTQRTPTSATTKPALTAMFMRLLIITPFWIALTIPPWRIITTRRVILLTGSLILTWHARVSRVSRVILWRSATVRKTASFITGLYFDGATVNLSKVQIAEDQAIPTGATGKAGESEITKGLRPPNLQLNHRRVSSRGAKSAGVKFTFIIYENQRRWVGLGWTNSLFAYERGAWTDEHNNAVQSKAEFELPEVGDGSPMRWRWVSGSRWKVDGVADDSDADGDGGANGWIYYDNKWQNGRRGSDGWGKWTRRRKWYRDAELVELEDDDADANVDVKVDKDAPSIVELEARESKGQLTPQLHMQSYSTKNDRMVPSPQAPGFSFEEAQQAKPIVPGGEDTVAADDSASTYTQKSTSHRGDDAASVTSNSSRSFFSLRRKNTDRSGVLEKDKDKGKDTRRDEDNDDDTGLGTGLDMELQRGRDGGQWGIGDEARMVLE